MQIVASVSISDGADWIYGTSTNATFVSFRDLGTVGYLPLSIYKPVVEIFVAKDSNFVHIYRFKPSGFYLIQGAANRFDDVIPIFGADLNSSVIHSFSSSLKQFKYTLKKDLAKGES